MASATGVPPTVILDGPVFSDELRYPPTTIRDTHGVTCLRLVAAKSAASGVSGVYFAPEHREWALVRLATRYRWLFEIQLNRSLSAERQLFRQGFEEADVEFLFSIFPLPPEEYNPIVYDMLWLVATFDQYLSLTRAILDAGRFTPRELLESTDDLGVEDAGYLTRFLRSHLVQPVTGPRWPTDGGSGPARGDLSVDLDGTYTTTPEGETALEGVLAEYDRIFVRQEFLPLLIDHGLDPEGHLRDRLQTADDDGTPSVGVEDLADEGGVLGEIARSFSSLDGADPLPEERDETDGEATFGSFSRETVLEATVAAAETIRAAGVARTVAVKRAAWEAAGADDEPRSELWDLVCDALGEMPSVGGRRDGRVWVSLRR
jgi:hypothetical protein